MRNLHLSSPVNGVLPHCKLQYHVLYFRVSPAYLWSSCSRYTYVLARHTVPTSVGNQVRCFCPGRSGAAPDLSPAIQLRATIANPIQDHSSWGFFACFGHRTNSQALEYSVTGRYGFPITFSSGMGLPFQPEACSIWSAVKPLVCSCLVIVFSLDTFISLSFYHHGSRQRT